REPPGDGTYPAIEVGSALNEVVITSVMTTPLAVTATADEQAPEAIEEVGSAAVPGAIVTVSVPFASGTVTVRFGVSRLGWRARRRPGRRVRQRSDAGAVIFERVMQRV